MMPWLQKGLLETKKTNRSLPLVPVGSSMENLDLRALMGKVSKLLYSSAAELLWWEEEEGWESSSHPTGQL